MQSLFAKSLLGACAAAFLAGGAAVAQTGAQTGTQPPAQSGGQAAGQEQMQQPAQDTGQAAAPNGDQKGTGNAATNAQQSGATFSADTVVATVGGTPITLGELIVARRSLPPEYQELPDEVLMSALVEQLANQALLEAAAREAGLDRKRAVQIAMDNQARAVLAGAYMEEEMARRVSPEAIEAAYQQRFADAEPVEEVHAAHILVEDEASAQEIKAKLDEGADFAELAAEYGTDGTASRGGDLGWFVHEQMVPQFADAAFAIEPGTISQPVQSPFGWHIIKLFERREQPVPPLDSVRDQLVQDLSQVAQSAILDEIRAGAVVERPAEAVPPSAVRADELVAE